MEGEEGEAVPQGGREAEEAEEAEEAAAEGRTWSTAAEKRRRSAQAGADMMVFFLPFLLAFALRRGTAAHRYTSKYGQTSTGVSLKQARVNTEPHGE